VAEGRGAIEQRKQLQLRRLLPQLVSELASVNPTAATEYLLGEEPSWADLQTGRAVERECDGLVYEAAREILSSSAPSPPLVISGTAGSGKSTCLMRLGLRLSAEGVPVYWIDEQSNIEPHRLRDAVFRNDGPVAILVDDADLWGRTTSGWARELPQLRSGVLFGAAVRSSKVDGLLDMETLAGIEPRELSMAPLGDSDIEALIRVLDAHNRLGVLKGKSHEDRVGAFREKAGRQLLVAMIEATSGKNFKEKVYEEFAELSDIQRFLYAVICFVHSQRYSLDRDEILLATGRYDNETMNELERLSQRHIIARDDVQSGYRARHRVIADEVVNAMQFRDYIGPVLEGVCFAFATKVGPNLPRTARSWRRLIRFVNHDYILQMVAPDVGRQAYERTEELLNWDYQYWLQRGSLEVEQGDLERATTFLGQA
jgi:Mrp family chromosome partitioning ATPase